VSVAAGDRPRFDAAWRWTRAHLLEPSGHLAWHWQHGSVTGAAPAADADVDAAFALELAARRFGERSDQAAAAMIASAVLHDETASTPEGPVLVAGPWAVGPPPYVDPSYASPSELAALGSAGPGTGTGSLATVASASRALTGRVLGTFALPPDWVQVASDGRPSAVSPPGADTSGDVYGFDAVRLPIRWGASCTAADRQAVAGLWPVLGRAARRGAPTVDLRVTDSSGGGGVASAVGVVAAAAAGWAAGHHATALQLLDKAEAKERANPTYYSSAWVALGRLNLETRRLGTCGGT
jgi:endoglucanase